MAKLPPKPRNIVHDYFPVGTDGQSPMNALDGSAWEAMKFKQGELDEDGKPIRSVLNKIGDPDDADELPQILNENVEASGTRGGDPDKSIDFGKFDQPDPKPQPKPSRSKVQRVKDRQDWRTAKVAARVHNKKVKANNKLEIQKIRAQAKRDRENIKKGKQTPILSMQAGKAKKEEERKPSRMDDTPKMPARIAKRISDYKKRWANHPSNQ